MRQVGRGVFTSSLHVILLLLLLPDIIRYSLWILEYTKSETPLYTDHVDQLVVLAETENASEGTDGVIVIGSSSVVACSSVIVHL